MDSTRQHHQEADPSSQTEASTKRWYAAGLIISIVVFLPCLYIARKHQLTGLQARLFYDFNNLPGWGTRPALWITEALGAAYPIALCILVPLLYKRYHLAWRFLVAAGATGVAMEAAKLIAKEPRPAALLHGHLHMRAVETGLNSFPSGHAAIATALAMTVWLLLPRAWKWVSVLWIVIVAVSRLYLGVHTVVDILGGVAIGLAVSWTLRLLPASLATRLWLDDANLLQKGMQQAREQNGTPQ